MIRRTSIPYLLLLFSSVLLLTACGEELTPEAEVRQFIATAKAAAEKRDVIGLSELVSEHYGDNSRRDRRELIGMTTGYFLRHKNIHLFTQVETIAFPAADQSEVILYVAMAGTPVAGAQALIDLRADLYRFDLTLGKENDEWRLLRGRWQRANVKEVFGAD